MLSCISGYQVAGQNRYAAIWIKGPALTWQARHGRSDAEYQSDFDNMLVRGFRLVNVNGYPFLGKARYAAIWHKPDKSVGLRDENLSFINGTVADFMKKHKVPGVSIALTFRERLVFALGYGLADQDTNEPVTTKHLFRIASVSKPITSAAVFKLIESGLLNLNDRVFGDNGILGIRFGTNKYSSDILQITVHHLLEHTSGWERAQDPMFGHFNLNQHELITWLLDSMTTNLEIASVISAILWPTAILIILFVIRKHLPDLVKSIFSNVKDSKFPGYSQSF